MHNSPFLNTVRKTIQDNALLDSDALHLVALSGGADSVALLLCLNELGYRVEAMHCNFHLRGEESDRDENFCKKLCEEKEIPLHIAHFDTHSYAQLHKVSIEMAARDLRYNYFDQLLTDLNAADICIGHHLEDSVETLLINLTRGTGINGLTGISIRNGNIVRPLLNVSRQDIELYLSLCHQDYITDSTNLVDDVTRNKIRLNIIPLLKDINPSVERDIALTAQRINEAAKVFNHAIENAKNDVFTEEPSCAIVDIDLLKKQISPEYTLYNILSGYSFSPAAIEDIYHKLGTLTTGSSFSSATHRIAVDRGRLLIEPISSTNRNVNIRIPETGVYVIDNEKNKKLRVESIDVAHFIIDKRKQVACLDAKGIEFPLIVRSIEKGDSFVPFGMKGRKLVSDYLTDRKLSLFEKERQLVVTDCSGKILWLVGERSDNRFRIKADTTRVFRLVWE